MAWRVMEYEVIETEMKRGGRRMRFLEGVRQRGRVSSYEFGETQRRGVRERERENSGVESNYLL